MSPLILFALSFCFDPYPAPDVHKFNVYVDNRFEESVTTNAFTVGGLQPGRVYGFKVSAVNDQGLESDPSNEVRYVMPVLTINPDLVVSFQVPDQTKWANQVYHLESTADFKTWREETYLIMPGEIGKLFIGLPEPYRFYRVRLEIKKEGCNSI